MPNTIDNKNLFLDTQFQQFVQFAEGAVAAGKEKAVARLSESELGGIVTRTIKPTSADWVGVGAGRLSSLKKANNTTREAFMKAVAEMFGGEDHIPGSVKDAMKLEDYGKGRPLTARRILAVKAAIDNDGTYAKLVGSFRSTDSAHVAQRLGWLPSEMPKLARAARYLSAITGEAEVESIERLSTPGTKENRLLNYGGRFLESAGNFKNGMRLLDTFKDWFAGVNDALVANGGEWADRKEGMSPTLLTASVACFTPKMRLGFEKFVFEYIAQDPAFDLAEKDATRLFGMENNVASHFFGRHLNQACTQAIAQIPPERRKTFFKAVTMFFPVVHTAEDANKKPKDRGEPRDNKIVVARVLKNLDKIEELEARGELTFKNLAKVCVPELPEDSAFEFREVGKAISDVADNVMPEIVKRKLNLQLLVPVLSTLQETGCSLDEAIESVTGGKPQPLAPYMASGTLGLDAFDGTTKAGRKRLESDLVRPFGYTDVKRGKVLIPDEKSAFRFRFPGEDPIATDSSAQGKKNIGTVIDKIEAMCGKLRPRQASNVMTMVSQSALAILRGGLSIYGIDTNEHGGCDFTLSKNEKTGEILIRYSSPEELPFSFEWTATVGLDGSVTSTPMRFTDAETLQKDTAAATPVLTEAILLAGHQDKAAVDRIVAGLIDKTRGDRELLSLLTAKDGAAARNIAMNGEMVLRSDEEITKRLEALRANVDELRTAAGGDKCVFDIAMGQLKRLGGKALPSGTITQIVDLTAKADVSALKGLSAKSSASALTKAMCAMDRIVTDICGKTQVMKNFGFSMAAEGSTVNSMIMGLVFARMDARSLNGIKATFYSNTNVQVKAALDKLDNYEFPKGSHYDAKTKEAMHRMAHSLGWTFRMDFGEMLCDALGQAEADMLPDPEDEIEPDPNIFKAVNDLVEKQITEVHHDLLQEDPVRA